MLGVVSAAPDGADATRSDSATAVGLDALRMRAPGLAEMHRRLAFIDDSAALDAPVLWRTKVTGARGAVGGASVVAYVRAASDSPVDPGLVPVAKASSGPDGTVELRLDPADVAEYAESGAVQMWYVFSAGGDFTLRGDTVYLPDAGQPNWPTSATEHAQRSDRADEASRGERPGRGGPPTLTNAEVAATVAEETAGDQPATVPVDDSGAGAAGFRSGPTPPTLCEISANYGRMNRPVTVGTLYLAELWTSTFTYRNTTTYQTQWNVSLSFDAPIKNSGVQLGMGLGGTVAVTESVDSGSGSREAARATLAGQTKALKVRVQFEFQNDEWRCGYSTTPVYSYKLATYPVRSRLDLNRSDQEGTTLPSCTAKSVAVGSTGYLYRSSGSSHTDYGAEYSFSLGALGVSGSTSAQSSTTYSTQTQQFWVNNAGHTRYLCVSGSLSGTATVVATSMK